jgi:hypothetical protein
MVRDRKEALVEVGKLRSSGAWILDSTGIDPEGSDPFGEEFDIVPSIPFWRRWLGDNAIARIRVPHDYRDIQTLQSLFPEAIEVLEMPAPDDPIYGVSR